MTSFEIIAFLFWNSLFIHGIRAVTMYELGMPEGIYQERHPTSKKLFWWVRFYGLKYLGEFWMQPICTCTVCMSSLWGFVFYISFVQNIILFDVETLLYLPVYLISLAGLNFILINISNR